MEALCNVMMRSGAVLLTSGRLAALTVKVCGCLIVAQTSSPYFSTTSDNSTIET